ncbi:hypothetical protein ACIGZJ_34320 [Kitasatospora sp. NPDC052868]|uniref:hypothetical protein n=1 Tax=Kitasatospora sp. NPDC052868 TaxID=3364060 RepID=UPI0037CC8669
MDETKPRGEEPGSAGWDGAERRRTTADPVGHPAWWSPDRLPGLILVRTASELGSRIGLKVLQVLSDFIA